MGFREMVGIINKDKVISHEHSKIRLVVLFKEFKPLSKELPILSLLNLEVYLVISSTVQLSA
jgi:hypothetical protein